MQSPLQQAMLDAVKEQRDLIMSRRTLMANGAKFGAAGALAVGLAGSPALNRLTAMAQDFEDDVEVLNYALTLEHLEFAFYRDNIDLYTFDVDPFGNDIATYLAAIRDHEGAHVETLTQVITDLGGEPVEEGAYDFGVTDVATFLATAAALENTGVQAYDGAGASIEDPDLLTAAGTIVAVEARHASYLNLLNGVIPFPSAVEEPLTPDEVLEIAGQFIVDADATPEA